MVHDAVDTPWDDADRTPRQRWMAVLARAERTTLDQGLTALAGQGAIPPMRPVRTPETGLVAVEGRVGGTGRRFILGEVLVTRCSVAVGGRLGVGYVAGRDPRRAELAALLDALLQDPAWHPHVSRLVVAPEAARLTAARALEARRTAATRVAFTTLARGS